MTRQPGLEVNHLPGLGWRGKLARQAAFPRRSKPEAGVVPGIAQNDDSLDPLRPTLAQPLADQGGTHAFALERRRHGQRSQTCNIRPGDRWIEDDGSEKDMPSYLAVDLSDK